MSFRLATALVLIGATAAFADERPARLRMPQKPVLIWSFDKEHVFEQDGSKYVADLSGNNNHGLISDGQIADGKVGGALSVKGGKAALTSTKDCVGARSFAFWVRNEMKGDATQARPLMSWQGDARFRFQIALKGDQYGVTHHPPNDFFPGARRNDQWEHHVVVSAWSGEEAFWYINGKLAGKAKMPASHQVAGPFTLGADFAGAIDEVSMFQIALSETEASHLYYISVDGLAKKMPPLKEQPRVAAKPPAPPREQTEFVVPRGDGDEKTILSRTPPARIPPIDTAGAVAKEAETSRASSNPQYQDRLDVPGYLIGLRLTSGRGSTVRDKVLYSIQPVFETKAGAKLGRLQGAAGGDPVALVAKPGYAVGGFSVALGAENSISGIQLVYMKIEGDRLNPYDTYTSEAYGRLPQKRDFDGKGRWIVGINGQAGKDRINSMGVILARQTSRLLAGGKSVPVAVFEKLDAPAATHLALTEDGKHLIIAHDAQDRVTVFDVVTGKRVAVIDTPAPSFVLPRGDRLYIANRVDEATPLTVVSTSDWKQVERIACDVNKPFYLSAPSGKQFDKHILVSGRGKGGGNVVIDLARKRVINPVETEGHIHTASADGRTVVVQESWGTSSGGKPSVLTYREYIRGEKSIVRRPKEFLSSRPYLVNVRPGDWWFGDHGAYHGALPMNVAHDLEIAIPDQSQDLVYALRRAGLTAYKLGAGKLSEVGKHEVDEPVARIAPPDYAKLFDAPVSVTLGEKLYLFVADGKGNVLRCATAAFNNRDDEIKPAASIALAAGRFSLTDERVQLSYSHHYRHVLVLDNRDRMHLLDIDAQRVIRTVALAEPVLKIADRADYFVALTPSSLLLMDRMTGSVRRRIKLPGDEGLDLALHPGKTVSYVTFLDQALVKTQGQLAAKRVAMIDEQRGDIQILPRMFGRWIAVDPRGRYLYTAISEVSRQDEHAPGWVRRTLVGVDGLAAYDLNDTTPVFRSFDPAPGGFGQRLIIGPDGEDVSYVSGYGYQEPKKRDAEPWGYRMASLKAGDVESVRAIFEIQMPARGVLWERPQLSVRDIAFHPSLNLAAAIRGSEVLLYDRATGTPDTTRLKWPAGEFALLRRVMFTPGGRHLMVVGHASAKAEGDAAVAPAAPTPGVLGALELRAIALNLTEADVAALPKSVAPPVVIAADANVKLAPPRYRLSELAALKNPGKTPMDARAIAAAFTSAVVVVKGDGGSATGFFISEDGWVLTAAHALPMIGNPTVHYRVSGKEEMLKATARVVFVDAKRDLALIKIEPAGSGGAAGKVKSVAIEPATKIELGLATTIIGHPGVGDKILDFTVTDGVVSTVKREIEGQPFVQTSATVNRGVSGGPVFDDRGNVIGVVVLKAGIEAAAFAVPLNDIVAFLKIHASEK